MIQFRNVYKSLGQNVVLDGVCLEFRPHEITAIVGPNGVGKTTIFNILWGMVSPDRGTVEYNGCSSRDCFAVLSGDNNLYAKNTVKENVYFVGRLRKLSRKAIERNIEAASRSVPLYREIADTLYERLSFGQKRLMTLFATMVAEPKIIALDEPTEGLDWEHRTQLGAVLSSWKEKGTIVLIAHDAPFLCSVVDRFFFLKNGKTVLDMPSLTEAEFRDCYQTTFGEEIKP